MGSTAIDRIQAFYIKMVYSSYSKSSLGTLDINIIAIAI